MIFTFLATSATPSKWRMSSRELVSNKLARTTSRLIPKGQFNGEHKQVNVKEDDTRESQVKDDSQRWFLMPEAVEIVVR